MLWIAERVGKRDRPESSLNLKDAVIIGLVQWVALIPGVSFRGNHQRGPLRDLDRVAATRLAFFLAIPALVAAGAYEAIKEASVISTGVGCRSTVLATGSALSSATRQSPGCCDSWPSTASRCSSGIA